MSRKEINQIPIFEQLVKRTIKQREAAKILRMSRPSLMRLVGKGHLTARKVGAHHRLSRAEVVAYKLAQSGVRRGSLAAIASITEEFDF